MQVESFQFLFKHKIIKIPFKFMHLSDISESILIVLITNPMHQYEVKSDVNEEVFQSIIDYLIHNEYPNITIDNINDYQELSLEFDILSDFIESQKKKFGEYLVNLNGIKSNINKDTSYYEEQIAKKIDDYILNYDSNLMNLPFNTLFNIFHHKQLNLKDHNLAYEFVKNYFKKTNDLTSLILLETLDATQLTRKNLEESLKLCKQPFKPKIGFNHLLNFDQQTYENQKIYYIQTVTDSNLVGKSFYIVHPFKINNKEFALDCVDCNKAHSIFRLNEWVKDNVNQMFTMLENGVIKCVGSNFVLDVIGGNFQNGTQMHVEGQNNSDAQLWTYDSNQKMLKLKNRNFCLNIHKYKIANNSIINIWSLNNHKSQIWEIKLC